MWGTVEGETAVEMPGHALRVGTLQNRLRFAGACAVLFIAPTVNVVKANTWTDATGNNLYSDPGNWSGGVPSSYANIDLPALPASKRQIDLGGQSLFFNDFTANLAVSSGDYRIFNGSIQTGSLAVYGSSSGPLRLDANLVNSSGSLALNVGSGESADLTVIGGVIGNGSGGGAFDLYVGGATLLGSNTYSGATHISVEALKLQGNGSIAKSSRLNVYGAPVILTNTATDAVNRIGDTATISLTQSELKLLGGFERVGDIRFGPGAAGIVVQGSGGVAAKLMATSLTRLNGSIVTIDESQSNDAFLLTTPPALTGGGVGSKQLAILPWAISTSGSLMTYDGSGLPTDVGLRPLNASAEYETSLASATTNSNVWLSNPTTLTGSASIGGLVLGSTASIQLSAATLHLNNSAVSILSAGSLERSIFSGDGTLSFPGEAIFHVQPAQPDANIASAAKVAVNVPINAQTVTKSGVGSLILARSNSYSGGTTIVQGTLICRAPGCLGSGPLTLVAGATLRLEQSMTLPSMSLQDEPSHQSSDAPDASISLATGQTLTVQGNFTAANAGQDLNILGGNAMVIHGNISGGSYYPKGPAMVIDGNVSAADFWPTTETVTVNGIWDSSAEIRHGTLTGKGTLHGWVEPNFINPGDGIGQMRIDDAHTSIFAADGMEFEFAGTIPGVSYDQLLITNSLELNRGGAQTKLSLNVTGTLQPTQQLTIIDVQSTRLVTGTFFGLPESATFTDDGYQFRISYTGGTGNDVVLTVLPEPGETAMLILALGAFPRRQHRKLFWN